MGGLERDGISSLDAISGTFLFPPSQKGLKNLPGRPEDPSIRGIRIEEKPRVEPVCPSRETGVSGFFYYNLTRFQAHSRGARNHVWRPQNMPRICPSPVPDPSILPLT